MERSMQSKVVLYGEMGKDLYPSGDGSCLESVLLSLGSSKEKKISTFKRPAYINHNALPLQSLFVGNMTKAGYQPCCQSWNLIFVINICQTDLHTIF